MSKLEIIPGWEVLKRIGNGTMKVGDQYRRLNIKYPISLFVVAEKHNKEEIMPSTKSFIEDKFIVLKPEYSGLEVDKEAATDKLEREYKDEALRVGAKHSTREEFKKSLIELKAECPSDYGLMDFCGQRCRDCINQALSECTVTFMGE